MRVLVIKTSSMGDVIHTLPALTDAADAFPGLRFDWVVEEGFAEIPRWHAAVEQVVPIAIRRWRKNPWQTLKTRPWRDIRRQLAGRGYVAAIDAQGLLKSAWIGLLTDAPRSGYNWRSAREPFSALFYNHRIDVPRDQHAVERIRQLMARSLSYDRPQGAPAYGIAPSRLDLSAARPDSLVFLHATTRADKHWPEPEWIQLAQLAAAGGYRICLPWADDEARARAERIAAHCPSAEVLPRLSLAAVAGLLHGASGAVAVDTGLGHLAAALDVPSVSLYGPTDPGLIGAYGLNQIHLRADSTPAEPFAGLDAGKVWQALRPILRRAAH